jgi:hypothetical protein
VPDQISRIFFGKGVSGSRPSYSSAYQPPADGYGAPQGYAAAGYPQPGYSYYYGENIYATQEEKESKNKKAGSPLYHSTVYIFKKIEKSTSIPDSEFLSF